MPGGFPILESICAGASVAADLANTRGIAITPGSHAYGSWVQLVPSTAQDTSWMVVQIHTSSPDGYNNGLRIGVGSSGAEKIIITDLQLYTPGVPYVGSTYALPLSISAGTKISAAAASSFSGAPTLPIYVDLQLFDGGFLGIECAGVDGLGAGLGGSVGTQLTSGAANTKGNYTTIVPSTARDYIGLGWVAGGAWQDLSVTQDRYLYDIAIGAAGAEQNLIADYFTASIAATISAPPFIPLPVQIPAGSRLSARSSAVGAAKSSGIVLYGLYQ
jgi:hypothetical protein